MRIWLHHWSGDGLWFLNCLVEIITIINDDLGYILRVDIEHESCWLVPWLEGSYLENSSLLASIGGMISASRDGPGASDFRGISARPPMLPSASKEADGVSILGCSSPTILSIRPDNKEGVRTGAIMSNPLVSRPGS